MIIGNGDIATALREIDCDDRLFFASGVSNSSETRDSEFKREKDLLFAQRGGLHIVYISSLSVFYLDTPYTQHKRSMEGLVRTYAWSYDIHYTIVRVGNITWGTNPHTLINFLRNRRTQGLPLEIQDVERYVIDKDEFLHWMKLIPEWSCEMNVTGRRMNVAQIVQEYVEPFARLEAVA